MKRSNAQVGVDMYVMGWLGSNVGYVHHDDMLRSMRRLPWHRRPVVWMRIRRALKLLHAQGYVLIGTEDGPPRTRRIYTATSRCRAVVTQNPSSFGLASK